MKSLQGEIKYYIPHQNYKINIKFSVTYLWNRLTLKYIYINTMDLCFTLEYYSDFKKKENSNTCCNLDESQRHYSKWNKPVTKREILHDSTYKK